MMERFFQQTMAKGSTTIIHAAVIALGIVLAPTSFAAPPSAAGAPAAGSKDSAAPSIAQSDPGTTEEVATIERAIESRVRDVLDGVIKPDKYAVYVQAIMR